MELINRIQENMFQQTRLAVWTKEQKDTDNFLAVKIKTLRQCLHGVGEPGLVG